MRPVPAPIGVTRGMSDARGPAEVADPTEQCTCVMQNRGDTTGPADAGGPRVLDLRDGTGCCASHTAPHRLLAALAHEIRPGGRLELTVRTADLTPELWEDLLVEAGFTVDEMVPLDGGDARDTGTTGTTGAGTVDAGTVDTGTTGASAGTGEPAATDAPAPCRLIRARRRERPAYPRVTSRPRGTGRVPTPHATLGVGVIVRDSAGRILLGLHHGGTWELPGGKLDPGESVTAAAVRELREETGLRTHERDVTVFAMLHDETGGLTRVSMAAVVTVYDGVPVAAEPELIREWRWAPVDELPSPLFVPSAQILTAWRPGLDIDHPPAHRLPVAGGHGLRATPA